MTIGEILEKEKKEWEYKSSQLQAYRIALEEAKSKGKDVETIARLTVKVIDYISGVYRNRG
jgi:hypothetical protein